MPDKARETRQDDKYSKGVFQPSRAQIAQEMKSRLNLRDSRPKDGGDSDDSGQPILGND